MKLRSLVETAQIAAIQLIFGAFLLGGAVLLCALPVFVVWRMLAE